MARRAGTRLTEVDDSRLGAVVDGLQLGNVDDAAAHRGGGNEAPSDKVIQRLAVDSCALLLLAAEVRSRRLGAPHNTVDVDGHDLLGCLRGAVDEGTVLPRNARVGDEDVQTAVELLDNLVDGLVHGVGRDDVDLVGAACWGSMSVPLTSNLWTAGLLVALDDLHLTPYVFSMFSASTRACLLLLYQIATLAPASARPWATARPIPAPAPETMAVRPFREKSGRTRSLLGMSMLSWGKAPFFISAAISNALFWGVRGVDLLVTVG